MAESAAFTPGTESSDHIAAAPRADEPLTSVEAGRSRLVGGLLRPSQVPVPGETTSRTGSPSPAGGRAPHGLQRLRPGGAPAGAALPLARPSTVPARPIREVLRGPGQPLADSLREEMQARLGADLSDVRVHTDGAACASAAEIGAHAYTSGSHVVIGDGGADKLTLAHELTHVIQQRQGPIAATGNGNGPIISNPGDRLEREAEAHAGQVMSGAAPAQRTVAPAAVAPPTVARQDVGGGTLLQRKLTEDLPEGNFRKRDVTQELRNQIAESAGTFKKQQADLKPRYDLLRSLGYPLDTAAQFMKIAEVATALPLYLEGAFSDTKRAALAGGYQQVRQAEREDLFSLATRQIRDVYPLTRLPASENLTEKLSAILTAAREDDEYISYDFLKKYIDAASVDERKAAGQSDDLLALILDRLAGRNDFPRLAIDLQIVTVGTVEHYRPEKADEVIRKALQEWIPDVLFDKQHIEGKAAILKGEAWERTLKTYMIGQPPGLIADTINTANAFTAPDGYVFISADRGNPGTMIHEGIHFYSPDAFLREYGEPLNEGVTEYFARKITDPLRIVRSQYADNLVAAQKLVRRVGEPTVLAAYFKGDLSGLAGIEIPKVKGEATD